MIAYLSQNADKRIFDAFRREGFDAVPLAPFSALSHPVDTHADMLLCDVGDTVFVHEDYQSEFKGFKNIVKIMKKFQANIQTTFYSTLPLLAKMRLPTLNLHRKACLTILKATVLQFTTFRRAMRIALPVS
jgi:hypothetical protein